MTAAPARRHPADRAGAGRWPRPSPVALAGLAAVALLALAAAACDPLTAADDGAPVRAVASFSVLGELVEAVGGDRVESTVIVPVGADPHGYEPQPSDAAALERADVVVDSGLGLNPWLEPLRGRVGGPVVEIGEVVGSAPAEDPTGRVDPHVWLDPRLLAEASGVVADALAEIDPAGADGYRVRAEAYRGELEALHAELRGTLSVIPDERRLLATYEYAFSYLAEAYDFEIVGSVVGATTEEEPSAAQVRDLIDAVERRGVAAVFPQTTEPPDVIERIARDSGAVRGRALHVDSVGEPGSDADSYAGMMRANAAALVEGLAGDAAGGAGDAAGAAGGVPLDDEEARP